MDKPGELTVTVGLVVKVLEELVQTFQQMENTLQAGGFYDGMQEATKDFQTGHDVSRWLKSKFNGLDELMVKCTQCTFSNDVIGLVIHLNDRHKWSREDVADYLDSLDIDLSIGEK